MEKETLLLPVPGCDLCITCFPKEDAPILLFLHGGPGSGAAPLLALPAFQELNRYFTAVYFDQRGSGDSYYDLSLEISQEQITQDVHAVAEWAKGRFPGRPLYLWGGSFGGLLGLLYLERFPQDAARAVISSPAVYPAPIKEQIPQMAEELKAQASRFPEEIIALLQELEGDGLLNGTPKADAVLRGLKRLPEGAEGPLYIYAMRRWFLTDCDARPALAKLKTPTLLVQGIEDPICPASLLLDAAKACGNPLVSLKTLSPCGHAPFDERPEEFVQILTGFFHAENN